MVRLWSDSSSDAGREFRLGVKQVPELPFEEAFLRSMALEARAALPDTVTLAMIGGITCRESVERAIDDGFGFVQIVSVQIPHF